jgi:hypothetical protein
MNPACHIYPFVDARDISEYVDRKSLSTEIINETQFHLFRMHI